MSPQERLGAFIIEKYLLREHIKMNHTRIHTTMRLLTLLIALIAATAPVWGKPKDKIENRPYADLKRFHLGFSIGMSMEDLVFTHNGLPASDGNEWYASVPAWSPGIDVSVLADLRLGQHFNLRFWPGMSFGSKRVEMISPTSTEKLSQEVKSIHVLLPLDLKISGNRYHNSRPYVTAGVMGAFDVGKKPNDYLKFTTFDTYLTVGIGCDFYLPFFKLNPEVKFCFGLSDILQHKRPDLDDDPATMRITESLTKVKSRMIMITFFFE